METGDPGVAMMWSVPVKEGLTPDEVIDSMKSLATERNFLFVGESPFYKQVEAITGEKYRYVNFLSFCDAQVGKAMLEYRDQYSGFMPCRIALVEDKDGRLWLHSMNLDLMIHGGTDAAAGAQGVGPAGARHHSRDHERGRGGGNLGRVRDPDSLPARRIQLRLRSGYRSAVPSAPWCPAAAPGPRSGPRPGVAGPRWSPD